MLAVFRKSNRMSALLDEYEPAGAGMALDLML